LQKTETAGKRCSGIGVGKRALSDERLGLIPVVCKAACVV
jgi:hypothetical protein